jgi:hypothetical protein
MSAAAKLPEHPFAIFGAGPYRFVGLETTEDRQATNAAASAAGLPYTTNMCGGSCDLCGQAIWNVFTFATADDRKFKVGCDCAEKAGEGQAVRDGKRERIANLRDGERRERMAAERRTREEREDGERAANFLLGHGSLTDNELAEKIVADREAAQQARRDASRHFGTVGERITGVELRYEGKYAFETLYGIQKLPRTHARSEYSHEAAALGSINEINSTDWLVIAADGKYVLELEMLPGESAAVAEARFDAAEDTPGPERAAEILRQYVAEMRS